MTRKRLLAGALAMTGLAGIIAPSLLDGASASSHREAPLITEDPVADLTDVYAFASPDAPGSTTLVMNVNPFELPAGGPNFHKFGDDVLYQFNIDNDGDAVADLEYELRFKTTTVNPNTFLYNTGRLTAADQSALSVKQTYTLHEVNNDTGVRTRLLTDAPVAPANVGPRSTPNYETELALPAVRTLPSGIKVFAGPRDDPFFVDLGSIFDLGGLRPFDAAHVIPLNDGSPPEDYVAGFNVHSIVLTVPNSKLTANGDPVIGVWASVYRRQTRTFDFTKNPARIYSGPWVQVARLGMPLVNEVVIPLGKKDKFNNSQPKNDFQFAGSVLNPELANLIPVLYPSLTAVPKNVDFGLGLGGREDIATIFLTGLPGLNKPANLTQPSEQLRINTATPAASQAFPNGRKLTDDVTDTELQALAGAFVGSGPSTLPPYSILGDGVNANDKPFTSTFPYLATPFDGYSS